MMDQVLPVWNSPMKLIGTLLLLLLLLLPVPPACSVDDEDFCGEMCRTKRDIYKVGREPFTFVCAESFASASQELNNCETQVPACDKVNTYDAIDATSFSFLCHALKEAVKLDCAMECKNRLPPGTKDAFSFPCTDVGLEVDCTKCTDECPTTAGGGAGQYECPLEQGVHMIKCPPEEKTTTTEATTPVPQATTTTTTEMTTTSGSKKDEEEAGTDDTTLYIIVGAVVGGVLLLVGIGVLAFCCYRKRKRRQVAAAAEPPPPETSEVEQHPSTVDDDGWRKSMIPKDYPY